MFVTIVMEVVMPSATATPTVAEPDRDQWIVEVNIAGFRIMRHATRRRHLLTVNHQLFTPRPLPLRHAEAV